MRKDIEIHINTGDVVLVSPKKVILRTFRWINPETSPTPLLERYLYGEIDVPYTVSAKTILKEGVHVEIPYTPKYKEFYIRVRRVFEDGSFQYVYNDIDATPWFLATSSVHGGKVGNVFASTLPIISEKSFYVKLKNGIAYLYASTQSDLNVKEASRQNANCLLACFPGNNYKHPLTGVGLVRWVNSNNVSTSDLATVLQEQFNSDGVYVRNATYHYDTQQLELDISDLEN